MTNVRQSRWAVEGAVLALVPMSAFAADAIADPIVAQLTTALVTVGLVGAAALGVVVLIKIYKKVRGAI